MTIKEIAKLAGVSVTTVSYALNGTGNISEEVRRQVLSLAEEHGYRRNTMARNLRTGGSQTIGVLTEDITAWLTPEVIRGIRDYAEEHSKSLLLADLSLRYQIRDDGRDHKAYRARIRRELELLLSAQVEGIIYIGMHDRDVTDLLRPIEKPLCLVGCYSRDLPRVSYDHEAAAREIAEFFVRGGHRRLGVIAGPEESAARPKKRR